MGHYALLNACLPPTGNIITVTLTQVKNIVRITTTDLCVQKSAIHQHGGMESAARYTALRRHVNNITPAILKLAGKCVRLVRSI